MTRQDIHRPSVIQPADYHYVGMSCVKVEDLGDALFARAERERIGRHMAQTGGEYSQHSHGGSCHICGAHAIYTAVFHHAPSNSYVKTGMDCAEALEWDSGAGEAFRRNAQDAMKAVAGKRKAQATLEAAGLGAAWATYAGNDDSRDGAIVKDIVGKLVQYGNISPAQTSFLTRLVDAIARRPEIEAARKAESDAAAPVPVTDERLMVRGKVISIRRPKAFEMESTRTLIQHADGWKVWGTLPKALDGVAVGDTVEFKAPIKRSDKDEKFGFFSRPASARKLAA